MFPALFITRFAEMSPPARRTGLKLQLVWHDSQLAATLRSDQGWNSIEKVVPGGRTRRKFKGAPSPVRLHGVSGHGCRGSGGSFQLLGIAASRARATVLVGQVQIHAPVLIGLVLPPLTVLAKDWVATP
jgi:hypothetical protein